MLNKYQEDQFVWLDNLPIYTDYDAKIDITNLIGDTDLDELCLSLDGDGLTTLFNEGEDPDYLLSFSGYYSSMRR